MCSTSKIDAIRAVVGATASSPVVRQVSAVKLRHSRDKYFVVDIREADEIESEPFPDDIKADAEASMGKLFRLTGELDDWKKLDKTVTLVSRSGHRASCTATELMANGLSDVAVLTRGVTELKNPSATVPDLVVLLCTKSNPEKITLALSACASAASKGETVVLVLMSDGVCTFLRKGDNKEAQSETSLRVTETFVGEPFKPCGTLLKAFLGTGNGVILGCTSSIKNRHFEFGSDLLDCVKPIEMSDVLRMLGETKRHLQFM